MSEYLHWRYATKKFDITRKVSKQELEEVLEALRLSPSSFGLQPWKFIVIQNDVLRKKIRKHAWDQPQVTDASHLVVLCSIKNMDEDYIKNYVIKIAQARAVTPESLAVYQQMMLDTFKGKTPEEISHWTQKQVYLALGMFLFACAQKRIDSCPMEGFDPKKVDEVLGLEAQGVESVVLCPVGYRAGDDRYASLKKVRFDKNEIFIEK